MKLLLGLLLSALLAVLVTHWVLDDPGYVVIARAPWQIETSLAFLIFLLLLGFFIGYVLLRLLLNAIALPERTRRWRADRRAGRARRSLNAGLIALTERDWRRAERHLVRHAQYSDTPLLHYLAAASAAQEQGAADRRDDYLRAAHRCAPDAETAIGLTQADLQLRHHQFEQARVTLEKLRESAPKHVYVLKMLMQAHLQQRNWRQLAELLPQLRKLKVEDSAQLDELENRLHIGLLSNIASNHPQSVHQLWSQVPKRLRSDARLVKLYVDQLGKRGASAEVPGLLRQILKREWQPALVYLYGTVEGDDPDRQLAWAEQWLAEHDGDPVLLLTLGRLCVGRELWGKAQQYLEASIRAEPSAESYRMLGELLERLGERERAAECFRKGLALAEGTHRTRLRAAEETAVAKIPPPPEALKPAPSA